MSWFTSCGVWRKRCFQATFRPQPPDLQVAASTHQAQLALAPARFESGTVRVTGSDSACKGQTPHEIPAPETDGPCQWSVLLLRCYMRQHDHKFDWQTPHRCCPKVAHMTTCKAFERQTNSLQRGT
jgi:hypothetical protein